MFGPDKRKRDGLQPQCRTCRRRSSLKYTKTEKGKATGQRAKKQYRQTDKGRETEKQYKSTERYKTAARAYSKSYRQREDKQDILRRWLQSPKRKAYAAQYWKVEKNKLRMKEHQQRYNQSEKGNHKSEEDPNSAAELCRQGGAGHLAADGGQRLCLRAEKWITLSLHPGRLQDGLQMREGHGGHATHVAAYVRVAARNGWGRSPDRAGVGWLADADDGRAVQSLGPGSQG